MLNRFVINTSFLPYPRMFCISSLHGMYYFLRLFAAGGMCPNCLLYRYGSGKCHLYGHHRSASGAEFVIDSGCGIRQDNCPETGGNLFIIKQEFCAQTQAIDNTLLRQCVYVFQSFKFPDLNFAAEKQKSLICLCAGTPEY